MVNETPLFLLAEDDADYTFIFQQACEELGFHPLPAVAQHGDDVMTVLNALDQFPDILFLDINMPRRNGILVLQEIRRNSHWNKMAVVILTNSNDHSNIEEAYEGGADLYLYKPTAYQAYRDMLKKVLYMGKDTLLSKKVPEAFVLTETLSDTPGMAAH